jgi:hypothetical protein
VTWSSTTAFKCSPDHNRPDFLNNVKRNHAQDRIESIFVAMLSSVRPGACLDGGAGAMSLPGSASEALTNPTKTAWSLIWPRYIYSGEISGLMISAIRKNTIEQRDQRCQPPTMEYPTPQPHVKGWRQRERPTDIACLVMLAACS